MNKKISSSNRKKPTYRKKIVDLLKATGARLTRAEVMQFLIGDSDDEQRRRTIERALDQLVKDNEIERVSRGVYQYTQAFQKRKALEHWMITNKWGS